MQTIVRTKRLRLCLLDASDAALCADYVARNKAFHVHAGPLRSQEYYGVDYWAKHLPGSLDRANETVALEFFLMPSSGAARILGDCTFSGFLFGAFEACYVGYRLDERSVGQGYMTEALAGALDYVFEVKKIHRVMANYKPTNARSGNLLRRLGFQVEGYARDYLQLNGRWEDHILTALRSDQWASASQIPAYHS